MPEGFFKFQLCTAEAHQCRITPGYDIYIDRWKQQPLMPVNFPTETLDPVANHSAANFSAYRNAQARTKQIIFVPDNKEAFYGNLTRSNKQFKKISTFTQP